MSILFYTDLSETVKKKKYTNHGSNDNVLRKGNNWSPTDLI